MRRNSRQFQVLKHIHKTNNRWDNIHKPKSLHTAHVCRLCDMLTRRQMYKLFRLPTPQTSTFIYFCKSCYQNILMKQCVGLYSNDIEACF